jgi:hypothetical protein
VPDADLSQVRTVPVSGRSNKVSATDFAHRLLTIAAFTLFSHHFRTFSKPATFSQWSMQSPMQRTTATACFACSAATLSKQVSRHC